MRSDRGRASPARAAWLALFGLAAGCSVEPYPDNANAQRRVSEEVFWVMCKRIAREVYPDDVSGRRFNDVCNGSGDSTGALASPQAGRMRAIVDRRQQIVAALDQVFADTSVPGSRPFGDDEITRFLAAIVPFYDPPDQILPAASDAIAGVLAKLIDPLTAEATPSDPNNPDAQRAQAVLKKFEAVAKRRGYRPANRSLGFLHPILTYQGLDDVGRELLGFVGKGGGGYDSMVALLKAAALELAEEAEPADPADPDRVDTTLHATLDLLLQPDDTLAEAGEPPAWVLRRDPSGNALVKAGTAGTPPTPFPVPTSGGSGYEPASEAYEFFDASKTVLAGAMRETKGIVQRPNADTPSTLDNLMRGLRPVMGPTVARSYDFAGKPYTFQGPDLAQGAMLDLVHAAGVFATYPEVVDAIDLVVQLLDKHESAAAGPVSVGIKINDRADLHEDATLLGYDGTPNTANELWDDLLAVAMRMAKREGQLEAVVKSFADERSALQGKLYGTWMRHKDDAPYVGAPITPDGPGPADFGGAYTPEQHTQMNTPVSFEYSVPVDRAQPLVGMNRSIWQRTLSLINGLNGVQICNPAGSSLTVGVEIIGSLKFPSTTDYTECECINIQDALEIYGSAVAGRGRLQVQDASALLLGAAGAPLGLVKGVPPLSPFGTIFEAYTDIVGLTDTPNAPALARFIYAPRNDFLETLMGPSQLSRDGVPMEIYEPHAMFHLENPQAIANNNSFLTVGVPLVDAFDRTELRELDPLGQPVKLLDGYMFGTLLAALHKHWPQRVDSSCELPIMPGQEGCTQSLDPKAPFYARQSNAVSYEPLLIESLIDEDLTGVLHRAAAEVQTVSVNGKDGLKVLADLAKRLLTPDPALSYRDGRKFSMTNTCVVPPGTIDAPSRCECPPGTSDADEETCQVGARRIPRGRIIEGGVPPIYLVLDALKKIDNAFAGDNAERLAPWRQARSNLVDQFLTADFDGNANQYRMRNQRARFLGIKIFQWVRDRIVAHRDAGDLATWGPELATRFEDTFRHPLVAGALDLLDKFWEDKEAATQFAAISAHIMDPQGNPEGFANFMVALADTLTLVDREPDITPLVQFASLVVAPNAFQALDTGAAPDVEHGAAYLGLEVARNVMGVDETPEPSAISKLLNNVVIAGGGGVPAEVLFDMIAEINRREPATPADVPLNASDQRAVFEQIRQFMIDPDHGLRRLYSVIQNRKVR